MPRGPHHKRFSQEDHPGPVCVLMRRSITWGEEMSIQRTMLQLMSALKDWISSLMEHEWWNLHRIKHIWSSQCVLPVAIHDLPAYLQQNILLYYETGVIAKVEKNLYTPMWQCQLCTRLGSQTLEQWHVWRLIMLKPKLMQLYDSTETGKSKHCTKELSNHF